MDWKVYYTENRTYNGSVENVPIWEVLLIVERDRNHGRKIVSGGDYYIFDNERWQSVDSVGMLQYMARPGMYKRFLVGVMIDDDDWNEVVKKARNDPDFPVQTALHGYETKVAF